MTLTKDRLIGSIYKNTGLKRLQAKEAIDTMLKTIKETLESGEEILISGFGKFCIKEKGERRGRHPATGGDFMLGARRVVTFRSSSVLTDKINRKG
jgi:integration host factor subunit alpha